MRKLLVFGIIVAVMLALAIGLVSSNKKVSAQNTTPGQVNQAGAASSASGIKPALPSSITSFNISNPYCYQPDPAVNQCIINFRFIQANDNGTTPPFMVWLSITISGKTRFTGTAFFENTITYTYDQVPGGLQVPCGAPNAGGAGAQYGNIYGVQVSPLDSNHNAMSTDIANATCPAFAP